MTASRASAPRTRAPISLHGALHRRRRLLRVRLGERRRGGDDRRLRLQGEMPDTELSASHPGGASAPRLRPPISRSLTAPLHTRSSSPIKAPAPAYTREDDWAKRPKATVEELCDGTGPRSTCGEVGQFTSASFGEAARWDDLLTDTTTGLTGTPVSTVTAMHLPRVREHLRTRHPHAALPS